MGRGRPGFRKNCGPCACPTRRWRGVYELLNNPNLDNPVKLDVRLLEAEQVSTPMFIPGEYADDGIRYDVLWRSR